MSISYQTRDACFACLLGLLLSPATVSAETGENHASASSPRHTAIFNLEVSKGYGYLVGTTHLFVHNVSDTFQTEPPTDLSRAIPWPTTFTPPNLKRRMPRIDAESELAKSRYGKQVILDQQVMSTIEREIPDLAQTIHVNGDLSLRYFNRQQLANLHASKVAIVYGNGSAFLNPLANDSQQIHMVFHEAGHQLYELFGTIGSLLPQQAGSREAYENFYRRKFLVSEGAAVAMELIARERARNGLLNNDIPVGYRYTDYAKLLPALAHLPIEERFLGLSQARLNGGDDVLESNLEIALTQQMKVYDAWEAAQRDAHDHK